MSHGRRARRSGGTVMLSVLGVLSAAPARADDLRVAAERVAETWRDTGAHVELGDTRFLHEGETVTLALPATPEKECQVIGLIGARGLSFVAADASLFELTPDERISSVAGVLEITSCRVAPLRFVKVKSEGGRGAVETVVASATDALPAIHGVLLERTGGVLPAPPEMSILPPLPSPEKRADVAEARARREGAKTAPRVQWTAGADGKGEGRVVLEAGCHRIEVFAPDVRASGRLRLDLDATLRDEDGEVMAHDHTAAPDARIDTCVGQATTTTLLFEGAPGRAPVLSTRSSLPLPEHLPLTWGRDTRARMASALLPRHVGKLDGDAIFLAQGASGLTPVPMSLEPGGCYVAAVALERGHAHGLGLRAVLGARESVDERGTNDEASAVAFCARGSTHARIEVEARSRGVSWGLAVFRVQSGVWEGEP